MHYNYSIILYLILLKVEWNSLTQNRLLSSVLWNDTIEPLVSTFLVKVIIDTVWTEERAVWESLERTIFSIKLTHTLNVILSTIYTEKFRGTQNVGLILSIAAINTFLLRRLQIWQIGLKNQKLRIWNFKFELLQNDLWGLKWVRLNGSLT